VLAVEQKAESADDYGAMGHKDFTSFALSGTLENTSTSMV
jgi:hypothetical protein